MKTRHTLTTVAATLVVCCPLLAQVPMWERFETTVTNTRSYANPFADVTLTATFTRPSGSTVPFWGFYDGDGQGGQTGHIWKLRFMPDEAGEWRYTCAFSDGAPGAEGTFRCVQTSARPGPLRVDPDNPHWFIFADGSHKHLHGYSYLDFWSEFDEPWSNVVREIVLRDGYTILMATTYIRSPGTIGECGQKIQPTYAWVAEGDRVDWTRFDLATWKRLDQRLAWAADHNLVLYTFDGLFPQSDYGAKLIPQDKEDLYLRYTLARHAPYWNLLWNIGAEMWKGRRFHGPTAPEKNYGGSGYGPERVRGWAQKIRNLDPWKHPVSWHDQGQGGDLTEAERASWRHSAPEAVYAVVQNEFRAARPAYDFITGNYWGKPVFGCECTWEELDGMYGKPRNRTEVRRSIWGVSLAAGITLYADWTTDYDPAHGKTTRHYGHGRGRADVKRMNEFLSRLPWWTMAPHRELTADPDDVCLAAVGKRYAVFSESGATISLKLVAGSYQGEWFNPVDAAIPSTEPIALFDWQGGGRKFRTPVNTNSDGLNDWVLHLWSATSADRAGWRVLAAPAIGPLRVHPTNPRYFTDDGQRAIYLTGSHTWANLIDRGPSNPPPTFDFNAYLDLLQRHHHNLIRLWGRQVSWYHDPLTNDDAGYTASRQAMGQTRRLADRMNLAAMTPHGDLASSDYCLANLGHEYVVYAPSGGEITVDLAAVSGLFAVEWLHPVEGSTTSGALIQGGRKRSLRAPFAGDAVLYLKHEKSRQEERKTACQ